MVPPVQRWIGIFFVTSAELGGSRMGAFVYLEGASESISRARKLPIATSSSSL